MTHYECEMKGAFHRLTATDLDLWQRSLLLEAVALVTYLHIKSFYDETKTKHSQALEAFGKIALGKIALLGTALLDLMAFHMLAERFQRLRYAEIKRTSRRVDSNLVPRCPCEWPAHQKDRRQYF